MDPGSVIGVLLLVIVGVAAFYGLAVGISYIGFSLRAAAASLSVLTSFRGSLGKLSERDFEMYVGLSRLTGELQGNEVAKRLEARLRRRRELEMKGGRTAFEDAEVAYLKRAGHDDKIFGFGAMVKSMTKHWLAKRGRALGWMSAIFMSVVVLPVAAWYQADVVRSGHEDIGSQLGLFTYGATAVQVEDASKDSVPSLASVTGKDVFLLGQNDRQIVLFVPSTGVTEFVPTSLLVVKSR